MEIVGLCRATVVVTSEKSPGTHYTRKEWTSQPVQMDAQNIAFMGVRIPNVPACGE
jgi:hypothetical protein